MISSLLIYNKFRYHTHKIRLEKVVPLNYRFPTGNKQTSNKMDQTVFKLDFWQKSGFPKIWDLSPVAPREVYISRNDPKKILEMQENIKNRHFLIKRVPFLCLFSENPGPQTEFVRKMPVGRGICFGRSQMISQLDKREAAHAPNGELARVFINLKLMKTTFGFIW